MSAGDSHRADMVDRLDAPFWVKAWNWMFNPPFDAEEEAPPYEPHKEEPLPFFMRWTGWAIWIAAWVIVVFVVIVTIWTVITGSPLEF